MPTDPLALATDAIRALVSRRLRPLSWLEATYLVTDSLSVEDATQVLARLLQQRYLALYDADMAQMLAVRLGVEIHWSHSTFKGDGEWVEGRGTE